MTAKRSERKIGRFLVILQFLASALERLREKKVKDKVRYTVSTIISQTTQMAPKELFEHNI